MCGLRSLVSVVMFASFDSGRFDQLSKAVRHFSQRRRAGCCRERALIRNERLGSE